MAAQQHWPIIEVLAAYIGRIVGDDVASTWNERQRSVNNCCSCKWGIWAVICSLLCITYVLAAFIVNNASDTGAATFWQWASMERQQSMLCHHAYSKGRATGATNGQSIRCLYWEYCWWRCRYTLKWASTERQWCLVMNVRHLGSDLLSVIYTWRIGHMYMQNRKWPSCCHMLKRASTEC